MVMFYRANADAHTRARTVRKFNQKRLIQRLLLQSPSSFLPSFLIYGLHFESINGMCWYVVKTLQGDCISRAELLFWRSSKQPWMHTSIWCTSETLHAFLACITFDVSLLYARTPRVTCFQNVGTTFSFPFWMRIVLCCCWWDYKHCATV